MRSTLKETGGMDERTELGDLSDGDSVSTVKSDSTLRPIDSTASLVIEAMERM